jgi:hypothetical protein
MSYVAVDRDIWTSTVLKEGPVVVATWLLLMADADRYGITRATPTSIASVLRVSDEEVEAAYEILLRPDKNSRNRDKGGARLERLEDGSYHLVSFSKYKERASKQNAARRQRDYLERKKVKEGKETLVYDGLTPEETAAVFQDEAPSPVPEPPPKTKKVKKEAKPTQDRYIPEPIVVEPEGSMGPWDDPK